MIPPPAFPGSAAGSGYRICRAYCALRRMYQGGDCDLWAIFSRAGDYVIPFVCISISMELAFFCDTGFLRFCAWKRSIIVC